ncbi:hypothetical protein KCU65_g9382, partial [Aureobasidium melanogenum]
MYITRRQLGVYVALDININIKTFWQLYQPANLAQLIQGATNQAPFNPHGHGGQQPAPAFQNLAFQHAFVNNNFQNGVQNPAIHPALLNHHFQLSPQNSVIQPQQNAPIQNTGNQNHVFQQNPINQAPVVPQMHPIQNNVLQQNHVFPQMPAIQNNPALNAVVRPKAPRRKRKPKPKPLLPLGDAPFRFMELPLEIRLMIYKVLLEETSTSLTLLTQGFTDQEIVRRGYLKKQPKPASGRQILLKKVHKSSDEDITHLQPVILRVSKTICDEAISILYRQTFEFEHPIALKKFLFTIGPNNRLLLQNIVLRGWQDDEFPVWQQAVASAFDRLLTVQNLRSIRMDRHVSSSSDMPLVYRDEWKLGHIKHFNMRVEYWAQCIDAAKGKGTARSLLSFTDRNFGSEDEIAEDDQDFLDRKKLFIDNMKLG